MCLLRTDTDLQDKTLLSSFYSISLKCKILCNIKLFLLQSVKNVLLELSNHLLCGEKFQSAAQFGLLVAAKRSGVS